MFRREAPFAVGQVGPDVLAVHGCVQGRQSKDINPSTSRWNRGGGGIWYNCLALLPQGRLLQPCASVDEPVGDLVNLEPGHFGQSVLFLNTQMAHLITLASDYPQLLPFTRRTHPTHMRARNRLPF